MYEFRRSCASVNWGSSVRLKAHHSYRGHTAHRGQQGATLIEVLISVLLISLGMLAVAGMQAYSLAGQRNASNRAIASTMANELAELIRLNPDGLNAGNYSVAFLSTTAAGAPNLSACPGVADADVNPMEYPFCKSTANLAAFDITDFQRRVRANLPIGGVQVVANVAAAPARSTADIWITWQEPQVIAATETNSDNCSAASKALATLPRCFYMRVQL